MNTHKKFKSIPNFQTEEQERIFWDTHDSTEYIDWSKAQKAYFPDLLAQDKHSSKKNLTNNMDTHMFINDAPRKKTPTKK